MFAEKFGFTPQTIRDMDIDDFSMLQYAVEKVNEEQDKANKNNNNQGGSQANGQSNKITTTNDLIQYAQSRRDCEVVKREDTVS